MSEESQLIKKAQEGDERAFEALLRNNYDRIFAMAYSWCQNPDTAQDITQQVCIAISRGIGGFKFQSSFLTWVYRITINTAKNMATAERRRRHMETSYTHDHHESVTYSNAENLLSARQQLSRLDDLPAALKETLWLVHYEGLNHKQAAQVLGCAELTVSWRIHKARKLLGEK